jgi:hypothetical protein
MASSETLAAQTVKAPYPFMYAKARRPRHRTRQEPCGQRAGKVDSGVGEGFSSEVASAIGVSASALSHYGTSGRTSQGRPCHRRPRVARSVRRTPDAARGHRILSRGRSVKKASTSSGTPATLRRTQAVVRPCRRLNSHVHGGDCPRSRPTSLARCSETRDQAACWTASVAQPASAIPERFTSS